MPFYRMIDHTADFGIIVSGIDKKKLFKNAALAISDLTLSARNPKVMTTEHISITGEDLTDLMVNWLRELLYFWNGKQMPVLGVEILLISEIGLLASVDFDIFDPERHDIKTEIKAVTYHQARTIQNDEGWTAQLIFDV
jgi:SHS2 domain-containing protein